MTRLRTARAVARSERGAALVMALLILIAITTFGLTLIGLGMTEVAISTNWRDYTRDFYAAEAGLESGVVGLRALLASTPQPTQKQLNQIAAPTLTTAGPTYNTYSITPLAPLYQSTFASGPYQGLFGIASAYQLRAQVNSQGGTRADLTQVFQYTQVPLFQFGVFYGQGVDLEIAPGPNMTFDGRVHANSNIYVGSQGTLSFNSYITTAGSIYRRIKRDTMVPWNQNPQIMNASGTYQTLNFDSQYQPGFSSTWATAAAWAAQATSTFGGMVKDGALGMGQITPPIPTLFQNPTNPDVVTHELIEMPQGSDSAALASAKLYSQANVRIVDGVATGLTCGTVPANAMTTKTFWDAREGKTMTATQLDINLLRSNSCLNYPSGVILYVATTNTSTNPVVRLVNGTQLPSGGMTVVSQNPVYVQGDYNTVSKVPAAVLGDAMTVLSNNWASNGSDALGTQAQSARPAATTTVNAAFALGPSAESASGQGNGQLENSIRFLEDWSGQTLNYAGSIVALWHSLQATGSWNTTYYTPPVRNWSYDTLFNTTPPPGAPQGVIMSKGRWSQS
jgi:Tfp pilus assembly protein PilX